MGAAIEIIDLTKRYGALEVVREVSLRIEPGEFLTLLGPSGSGKTTTLSAIAGFVLPSAGQICIGGRRMENLPPEARNIGVVFQHYALFPHMTVAENVAFPLEMRAMPRDGVAGMVRGALEAVHMADFAARFPSQLSGGQQQRIALARAIVFSPPVLLLDEPLGALDKKLRESMQIELKRLHSQTGITMVYVTHDQEEALVLSDRIAVMNAGTIEQVGGPEELYTRPRTRFVAEFMGESNFLDAEILGHQGVHAVFRTPSGLQCIASCSNLPANGGRASLMVRPERIVVGPAAAGLDNHFRGRIDEKIFVGGLIKYRLSLSPTDSVLAVRQNAGRGDIPDEIGAEIGVGWAPDDVRAYQA